MSGCSSRDSLPSLGSVADVSLMDQSGRVFKPQQLRGHVWIANFIFTNCPSVCPLLTVQMGNLQRRFSKTQPDIRFVSFSVDPKTDSPARLDQYARAHHANLASWFFVTGDLETIRNLIVNNFKLGLGEPVLAEGAQKYDIMHARYFVLVDQKGNIRGHYPSDKDGMTRLERDAQFLSGKAQ